MLLKLRNIGMDIRGTYPFYNKEEEIIDHIIINCDLACKNGQISTVIVLRLWILRLLIDWNIYGLVRVSIINFL